MKSLHALLPGLPGSVKSRRGWTLNRRERVLGHTERTVIRRVLFVTGIDKLGTGLYLSLATLYLRDVRHDSGTLIGVILGGFGLGGLIGGPIVGRLVDRRSRLGALRAMHLVRAVAFGAYALPVPWEVMALLGIVIGFCDRGAATINQVVITDIAGERRAELKARYRVVSNAAVAIGSVVGAGIAAGHHPALVESAILIDAASFVVCVLLLLLPAAWPEPNPRPVNRSRLPPARMVVFMALDALVLTNSSWILIGVPLWVLEDGHVTTAVAPLVLTLNTGLVILIQRRISIRIPTAGAAGRWAPRAGVALVAGGMCLASSRGAPLAVNVGLIALATISFSLCEIVQAATSWEFALHLAPEGQRGAILGWYQVARGLEQGLGPLLVTAVIAFGGWGVVGLCGLCGLAGALEPLIVGVQGEAPASESALT